jgi:glucan endo-1,6-beta-glucosidase
MRNSPLRGPLQLSTASTIKMLLKITFVTLLATAHAWLPSADKIRGVNLGSQFIIERWMAESSWKNIGCSAYNDEWACVKGIGQSKADAGFKKHWDTWTTEADIKQIKDISLNTVRIPVGFWIRESLVNGDEYYPRGGLPYLDRLVGWCKKYGIYVIMDLHAAPGVQTPNEQFTGHVRDRYDERLIPYCIASS